MTQLTQFLFWQLREFGQAFRGITVSKVCVFLLGAQLASILIAVGKNDTNALDMLSLTIPVTLLVMAFSWIVEIQWDRFKREQEQIMKTLKDTK